MVDKIVNYMSKHKWKLNEMFNFQDFKSHWDVNIEKKKWLLQFLGFLRLFMKVTVLSWNSYRDNIRMAPMTQRGQQQRWEEHEHFPLVFRVSYDDKVAIAFILPLFKICHFLFCFKLSHVLLGILPSMHIDRYT